MPARCQVWMLLGNWMLQCSQSKPSRCQIGKPWDTQGHNVATESLRGAQPGSFWGKTMILPGYAFQMGGCGILPSRWEVAEFLGNARPSLSEYDFEMPRWKTFGTLEWI